MLEEDTDECPLYTLQSPSSIPPIKVLITLESLPVEMILDTGEVYSIMSESNFRLLFPDKELAPLQFSCVHTQDRGTG